jgi:hypothetical protein
MSDELSSLDPNLQWIVSEAKRPVAVDAAARLRLLDAVRAEPLPQRRSRVLGWLVEPRRFSLPPLATAAVAAGFVGLGVIAGLLYNRDGRAPTEQDLPVAVQPQLPDSIDPRAVKFVKFVLIAPQAARVSVVGDFNGWDRAATPAERQADGTWTAFVPLRPGRHVYSFVLDGTHFVSDPEAPIAPDDGYGQRNSVVVVAGASS